jgi:hypothetical protein
MRGWGSNEVRPQQLKERCVEKDVVDALLILDSLDDPFSVHLVNDGVKALTVDGQRNQVSSNGNTLYEISHEGDVSSYTLSAPGWAGCFI